MKFISSNTISRCKVGAEATLVGRATIDADRMRKEKTLRSNLANAPAITSNYVTGAGTKATKAQCVAVAQTKIVPVTQAQQQQLKKKRPKSASLKMVAKHFAVNSAMAQLRANDWACESSGSALTTGKASQQPSEVHNLSSTGPQSKLAACMKSLEGAELLGGLSRNAMRQKRKEGGRLISFSTRDLHALNREKSNCITFDLSSKVGLLSNAKEAQKYTHYLALKQKKINT